MLEEWRRRAIRPSDPEAFGRSVRRAAELSTGEPVLDDEPFEVTRADVGCIPTEPGFSGSGTA